MSKVPILGCALLSILIFLRIWDHPLGLAEFPGKECESFKSWLRSRFRSYAELDTALPVPDPDFPAAGIGLWPRVASEIFAWAGWPLRTKFAKFEEHTLEQLMASPALQSGAFVIVIPGPPLKTGSLRLRASSQPWVEAKPPSLASALPLRTLETLAMVLESKLHGRRLPTFTVEAAAMYALPLCKSGGACAIWEGSTGRIILDADVTRRMSFSPTVATLLVKFTDAFASQLSGGSFAAASTAGSAEEGDSNALGKSHGEQTTAEVASSKEYLESSISSGLNDVITSSTMNKGDETADSDADNATTKNAAAGIANTAATAATAALTLILASQLPLWWCLACPITLGLLAPFMFNFGLTAAAEQLCGVMQLPSDECADLWWGAFALALVLSLGAAAPIVYVCRLPDCVKHAVTRTAAVAAVAAAAGAGAIAEGVA